jgi:hypothetical protein
VIVLGIILIVVGALTGIGILETLGIALAVIGLLVTLMGWVGRPVGGRRFWF